MFSSCGAGEDPWESIGLQGDQTSQSWRKINPEYSSEGLILKQKLNSFATWWEELTHWKKKKKTLMLEKIKGRRWGWQRMRWLDDISDSMDMLLLFSLSVMSDTLKPHGLQPTRVPYLSLSPGVWLKLMSIESMMPSHPLSPPSPPAFSLSQHQGLFQLVSSSHQLAEILKLQYQSIQWIFRVDLL